MQQVVRRPAGNPSGVILVAPAQPPLAHSGRGVAPGSGIYSAIPVSCGGLGRQAARSPGRHDIAQGAVHGHWGGGRQPGSIVSDWDAHDFLARLREARSKSNDDAKRVLRDVAENNYVHRNRWRVPRTVPVPYNRGMGSGVPIWDVNPSVIFSDLTTAEALLFLGKARRGMVCGLNFANGSHAGGGYKNGATAQEEDLCRRMPSLYTSLNNARREGFYPFGPSTCRTPADPCKYSDVLWTPDVVIARADETSGYAWLPDHDQVSACLVAAAAPNILFARPPEINDVEMLCNTIRTILVTPRLMRPEINTIVLGAWGCGAFGGDPAVMSQLFFRVLFQENYRQLYKEIHFAIPCFSKEDRNSAIFRDVFHRNRVPFTTLR
eukprot:TRINITY_DN55080_c0_g1_i1.p1 TRINITY_DN55080_c0_g1~~TRINITY_DN55080_c0_g1_i1.p1  ORF type:complete len:379 (+),score=46.33 TRINITY_DN55080_c0_g1_i1:76-1212(+)